MRHSFRVLLPGVLLVLVAGCDIEVLPAPAGGVAYLNPPDCVDCYETVWLEDVWYEPAYVYESYYVEDPVYIEEVSYEDYYFETESATYEWTYEDAYEYGYGGWYDPDPSGEGYYYEYDESGYDADDYSADFEFDEEVYGWDGRDWW